MSANIADVVLSSPFYNLMPAKVDNVGMIPVLPASGSVVAMSMTAITASGYNTNRAAVWTSTAVTLFGSGFKYVAISKKDDNTAYVFAVNSTTPAWKFGELSLSAGTVSSVITVTRNSTATVLRAAIEGGTDPFNGNSGVIMRKEANGNMSLTIGGASLQYYEFNPTTGASVTDSSTYTLGYDNYYSVDDTCGMQYITNSTTSYPARLSNPYYRKSGVRTSAGTGSILVYMGRGNNWAQEALFPFGNYAFTVQNNAQGNVFLRADIDRILKDMLRRNGVTI